MAGGRIVVVGDEGHIFKILRGAPGGGGVSGGAVVEDEANIVNLVRAYLERDGFTVDAVTDGRAALRHARTTRPHLIVLDLMLPGMDGLDVCRRLRQESDVYILMLTAKSEEADRIVGLEL